MVQSWTGMTLFQNNYMMVVTQQLKRSLREPQKIAYTFKCKQKLYSFTCK